MKIRYTAFMLALLVLVQVFAPEVARAKSSEPSKKTAVQLVKMGALDPKTYPKLDNKAILAIQKQARNNQNRFRTGRSGFFSAGSPYLPGQTPPDNEKAAAYGNLHVDFVAEGLKDNGVTKPFQWSEIFGTDSNGNPGTANIYFVQKDAKTNKKIATFKLTVDKAGEYSLNDFNGKPAKLPLYSKALEPYKYDVELETGVSEKVTLLTVDLSETGDKKPSFKKDGDGNIVADIPLYLKIGQTASTKFISEWHTGVAKDARPPVNGEFNNKIDEYPGYFPFSKDDGGSIIIRNDFVNNSDYQDPGYTEYPPSSLLSVPEVKVTEGIEFADENDTAGKPTYNFDEANKIITTLDGKHKFKYDFTYDVVKGGKLIMTEILPVTFDANGGKFANFTAPDTETKIVKEVEYDGTVVDKAENPTKDRETFKGWSLTKGGAIATDADFANIKEAKTLYAIWDNNEITAEELTVHESFKADGATEYTNNFIPTLDQLKGQVKIKGANGTPQALADDDTFEILDDSGAAITGDALKDYLYEKLKEKDNSNDEPTRVETVKAKVSHANGTIQTVDIPIKVIKNIYEAKTEEGKPNYVPEGYVKVTVDPTTKAEKPQQYFYYVNPAAKVVIPGKDPVGTGDNKFVKWTYRDNGTETEYKLADHPRHKFGAETTIEAQYVSDVIPQDGDTKPEGVPDNFVKVTFVPTDNGTMEGNKIFWVNPEKKVTIPVKDPVGKTYYTFKKWKIGVNADGAVYNPSTPTKFTDVNGTIITATYDESKKIIPYDPSAADPMVRPDGYVRVTFAADPGLKLTEQKAYYVKKNAGITLGNAELVKPKYSEDTGYKFDKWDKEDSLVIEASDIVVTAEATKLDKVIPEKDDKGNPNKKPKGYVEVEFRVGQSFGKISDGEITKYYVKPNTEVTLPLPKTEPYTGYVFDEWKLNDEEFTSKPTKFAANTAVWGWFKPLESIIPKVNDDGTENNKPKGYVTVTFDKGRDGEKITGQTVYYVDPNKGVLIKALTKPEVTPKVGYRFKEWLYADSTEIKDDLKVVADYTPLDGVIPKIKEDGTENEKPDGYVTVKLIPTDKATDETKADTTYYVNPTKEVTIPSKDPVGKKVTDKNGNTYTYLFKNWTVSKGTILPPWDKPETGNTEIKGTFTKETEITAKYNIKAEKLVNGPKVKENPITVIDKLPEAKDLIKNHYDPADPNNKDNLPDGTTFTYTPDGTPDVSKSGKPTAKVEVKYPNGKTMVVEVPITVVDNVVPQKGNEKPNVPDNYVKVTFEIEGEGGKIADDATEVYYVNPAKEVTVPQPKTKADTGYKFDKWDQDTATAKKYTDDTTVKGSFTKGTDIIPSTNDQGQPNTKPDGYVTVTFDKGANGKAISGQTAYYVNPNAGKKLSDITPKPTVTPDTGFTANGWDKEDMTEIKSDITVTAQYLPKDDVIPKTKEDGSDNDKPEGYVTVTFVKGEHGKELAGQSVYYVNPNKPVVLKDKAPTAVPNTGYKFARWDTSIDKPTLYKEGDTITALYNNPDVISTKEIAGYVKVEFKPGSHGNLSGPTDYWVKPDVDVYLPSPWVNANDGYQFDGWDKLLSVKFGAGAPTYVITAKYTEKQYPTPQPDPIPQPYPTPQPNFVPYPVPGETKTVYKDRTVLRREVRYMQGFEGKFRPDDGLTRAEAAQILANALKEDGYPFDLRYKLPYKDTTKEMWYNDAVRITTQADVFIGYDDGEFKPQRKITRAEWIATLRRFQYVDKVGGNSLHMRKNHWAIPEVEAAYRSGWLSIYTEKKAPFNYDEPISRKEVAAVSNRAFRRVRDMAYIRRNDKFMINYTDINRDMWAYDDILCASNTFLHQRQGAYIAYKRGDKAYTIDVKDAIIEQDLFQRIPRHR